MSKPRRTNRKRSAEVEDLKIQLAEAVETLDAIRSGGVDALVVHGPEGEQIFTLKGADQVYRTLVEAMNEGAVSVNQQHVVMYSNGRFAELMDKPLEKIIGSRISAFCALRERQKLAEFLK